MPRRGILAHSSVLHGLRENCLDMILAIASLFAAASGWPIMESSSPTHSTAALIHPSWTIARLSREVSSFTPPHSLPTSTTPPGFPQIHPPCPPFTPPPSLFSPPTLTSH